MKYTSPLIRGRLIKRYKRFLADIELDDNGETITAHCANPGSMLGIAIPGSIAWVSRSASKTRKLPYSLELLELDGTLVAINTNNPNQIAADAIGTGVIPELTGYETLRREVKYGESSRIDILLSGGRRKKNAYVEIKNVHLCRTAGLAEFPDCVTARGAKHLKELINVASMGERAIMLYIVQRGDCRQFKTADDLDPAYGLGLREAINAGVETLCYDCEVTTSEVRLRKPLDIEI